MYKCDICSKSYSDWHKLQSHKTRCRKRQRSDTASLRSDYSYKSSASRRSSASHKSSKSHRSGNTISDVEDVGKVVNKLSRDKIKLKKQIRLYSSELESRVSKHKVELRNAHDKIESLKKHNNNLEAKMRDKTNVTVERLEQTILKLQERLEQQSQEYKNAEQMTIDHYNESKMDMDEKLRELQQKYEETKEIARQELLKNQDLQRTIHIKQEEFRINAENEIQKKVKLVSREKDIRIKALEERCGILSQQLQNVEEKSSKDLKDSQTQLQYFLSKTGEEQSTLKTELLAYIEGEKNSYAEREIRIKNKHKKDLEEKDKQRIEQLQELQEEYERKINLITCQFTNLENKSKEEKTRLENETERIKKSYTIVAEKTKKKLKERYDAQIKKIRDEFNGKMYNMKTQSASILSQSSQKLGELTDLYEKQKQELERLQTSYNRLKENNKSVNEELLYKMNKQDMITVSSLEKKDELITKLQNDLKRMENECLDRLNANSRDLIYTKRLNTDQKEEIEKLREDKKENRERIKELEARVETLQVGLSSQRVNYEMKLDGEIGKHAKTKKALLDSELQKKEADARQKKNMDKVAILLKEKRDFISKLEKYEKRISEDTLEIRKLTRELESVRTELDHSNTTIKNYRRDIDEYKQNLDKEIKKDKDNLLEQLETERKRNSELYKDNSQMRTEFTRRLEEVTKRETNKGNHFEQKYNQKEEEYSKLKDSFAQLRKKKADSEKLFKNTVRNIKNELEKVEKKYEEKLALKESELRGVRNDMKKLHEKLVEETKSLYEEHKKKENMLLLEINSLQQAGRRNKVDMVLKKARDEALLSLRNHKRTIDKLEEEKKKLKESEEKLQDLLEAKTSEVGTLIESQNQVKANFADTLNKQNEMHLEEMKKKNERISELERLMMENLKNK